ncbi:electron transfer flavoprotein subunit beta/FixA family protein [Desulfosarcina ovata]|uniref:Electron transfer flavoprotein subunit beta n=1 Tax=Desulfosarcina ovata subsp. ovata TaxID=2752305 RepID=A0A5K8AGJ6_9BACT|nr:electron transfer flavoprotein subunit beta/FixA family protein [Desulfosarcina ovata]BBO91822.1 electron transfer flavoprotein subunit beta [Desulfosarcina ovata subsp. ovata]
MEIIVLVKQVPDTTNVKLDPKTGNLLREGLTGIINPEDRHALEAAVHIKETMGGKVKVLSMGPSQAVDACTEAIGMGADEAILLSDRAFAGADTWATAFTLGKAVERIGKFDLILCGRQAIDGDTAQVGPQLADYLDIPQVTYVQDIETMNETCTTVKRQLENGYERIECQLPALLTVIGTLNRPRHAHLGRLIDACTAKAPIKVFNAADIGVVTSDVGLEGSLTQVSKTFTPDFKRQGKILDGPKEQAVSELLKNISNSDAATACKAFAASCELS